MIIWRRFRPGVRRKRGSHGGFLPTRWESSSSAQHEPKDRLLNTKLSYEYTLQYHRLFRACDVDGNGFVTLPEIRETLCRFGLHGVSNDELVSMFKEADCLTASDGLGFQDFVKFVEHAVKAKTTARALIPEGSAPHFVRKGLRECSEYGRSLYLLFKQTTFASKMLLTFGTKLNKYDRQLVKGAAKDFGKVVPLAAILMAPGGSVLAPLVFRHFPSALPSTFNNLTEANRTEKVDATEKTAVATLEVAVRILFLEKRLREATLSSSTQQPKPS